MPQLQVNWIKTTDNRFFRLDTVDLTHQHFDNLNGVYIIWQTSQSPNVVRIGQGNIRERLTQHRTDREIQAYANRILLVIWARVSSEQIDGVEAYLAQQFTPAVGYRFPNVRLISVNHPE